MDIYLTQVAPIGSMAAVEEFPRSLMEFDRQFAAEQACRDYLFRLRWPEGFRCPRCSASRYWPVRSVLLECAECGHQMSVTEGTIFQDTRKLLTEWFRAMYWVIHPEERVQRAGPTTRTRTEELQDRLDLAAQVASRDGPAGTQPADGTGRGGRDFHSRRR